MVSSPSTESQLSRSEAPAGATVIHGPGASAMPVHICSQSFRGKGNSSGIGACSGELECSKLSPHDRLFLYQFGTDNHSHVTRNYIEISRDKEQVTFNIFIEALGGSQAVIRRSLGDRHMKLLIKTDRRYNGFYDCIRFMVFDPNHRVSDERLIAQWYDLPATQRIDSVGVGLALAKELNHPRILRSEPVGFNHFMAYGDMDTPETLKPGFEWKAGKSGAIPGLYIVSNHNESYRSPTAVDLRLWKEYVYFCL